MWGYQRPIRYRLQYQIVQRGRLVIFIPIVRFTISIPIHTIINGDIFPLMILPIITADRLIHRHLVLIIINSATVLLPFPISISGVMDHIQTDLGYRHRPVEIIQPSTVALVQAQVDHHQSEVQGPDLTPMKHRHRQLLPPFLHEVRCAHWWHLHWLQGQDSRCVGRPPVVGRTSKRCRRVCLGSRPRSRNPDEWPIVLRLALSLPISNSK